MKGFILDQMSGGSVKDLDPNLEERSTIYQTGVNSKNVHMRVFHAITPQKEKVTGASYIFEVPYNQFFKGKYGIAGYQTERDTLVDQSRRLKQKGINFRVQQSAKISLTEKLKLDSSLILRANAFLSTQLKGGEQSPYKPLYDADGNWLTKLELKTRNSQTSAIIDISGQDANVSSGEGFSLYLRRFGIEHTQRFKLANIDLESNTGVNVVPLEDVSPTVLSQMLTASKNGHQLSVRYVTPLFAMETPSFIGGSRPRTEIKAASSFLGGRIESGLNLIIYLPQEFEGTGFREKGFYFVGDDERPGVELISTETKFYRYVPGEFGGQIFLKFKY